MNRHGACAHYAPATLGLGLAKGRAHPRVGFGHAARMGHLIEAIRRRYWADLNGLKEDLVAGMTGAQIGFCHRWGNVL